MRIRSVETFLEVWDTLGEIADLEDRDALPPELERQWSGLAQSLRAYEAETMRPSPRGRAGLEDDGWLAIVTKAIAFRDALA